MVLCALSAERMDFAEIYLHDVTMKKCPEAMLTVRIEAMCYYLSFSPNSSTTSRASLSRWR